MAKVVSAIQARVEVIGRPRPSTYEPGTHYSPTLFIDLEQPEGSEAAKVWKNLSDDEVFHLKKGDRVQLVPVGTDKSGRLKHNIVLVDAPCPQSSTLPQPPAAQPTGLDPATKRAIADYVNGQADLLRFCWETAQAKLDGLATEEESIRCAASTLFIAAQKKFSL